MSSSTDVPDILRRAARAVSDAELPQDLRAVGFSAAVRLLANGAFEVGVAPTLTAELPLAGSNSSQGGGELHALSRYLGVTIQDVESVFFLDDDGSPKIGLARSRLGRSTAEAARQLALLGVAARQYSGDEQFTSSSVIRDLCQDFGVFDVSNFAKTLLAMRGEFQFQGSGVSRRVRLIRPGIEQAARLVQELAA